jgi:hypothetical protein
MASCELVFLPCWDVLQISVQLVVLVYSHRNAAVNTKISQVLVYVLRIAKHSDVT